jgi:transposase
VLGDKAYSSAAIRIYLRRRRIKATIPKPADQARNRLQRGGRPPAFDAAAYKQRNVVERAFCHFRQHRAVATRYDKRDYVWRGTADVASIRIWLRLPVSVRAMGRAGHPANRLLLATETGSGRIRGYPAVPGN